MKLLFILFLICFNSLAQEGKIIENKITHFSLQEELDIIDFIVIETVFNKTKPIFLFCQGSLPVPLIIDFEKGSPFIYGGGISNFDVEKIKEHYHLVVISMPETPLRVKRSNLNNQYAYVTDSADENSYKESFLKADYLENYVNRANAVLNFLLKQSWVEKTKLVVAGHSQGARVATKLVVDNINVTHLGLFGFNPFGRIEQMIRQERKDAEIGKKTWEEAEEGIAYWEQLWSDANNEDSVKSNPNLIAWKSFSQPQVNDLLKIDIPTYICYGTKDIIADHCDLLPILYTSAQKDNLTLTRKYGLQHNFFELNEEGRADYNKGHWIEVMNDFVKWTLEK
ncbi:MAG TPA: hypothetical protein EYG86_09065 [Crocinitomicaceae bacterium]|nr:hypothetical protein [Crocinitomicaceae bacterium]